VDNTPIAAQDTTSPYSVSWNTATASNGTHTLTALATDTSGNTATSAPVTVTVSNAGDITPPTVALTAPTGTVSGVVNVTANAADNVGVAGVQFLVDNTPVAAQDTTSPYSVSWNTATATNGTHMLTALATDTSGNTALSAPVTVTVSNAVTTAPPAFVQVNAATPQTNQSSVGVKYTGAQTAGNTNIVVVGWNNATSNITSVTDSAGNTYRVAVPTARGAGVSQAIYYASGINAAAPGTNTVTVNFNTATPYVDVRASEYSGLDPANPFDVATSASGTGASANSGTVNTTAASELILGAGTTSGVFSGAGPNFTTRIITVPDADIVQDRVVTSTGAYNATAQDVGYANWVMQVATFKAAAGSTGDITPPTVALTAPTGTVSGVVNVTANAADNVGVAGVQFLVDNTPIAAQDTTSPYSVSWNTATASNGTHTLTALATDTSGNTTTSAPVTVTVSNGGTPVFTATTLVSGLSGPTDFGFLPDGRILFTEKGGAIKVANSSGTLQSTPVMTVPVDSGQGRGLLAVAVDPNYQTNGYIYAAYTTVKDPAGNSYERLSRFTTVTNPTTGVLTADPASELVLIQGNQPGTADHFGGGLAFGPDGKLYFSTGDNVCCSVLDGSNSQNLTNMYGKVLRINPDGTVPTDNPFYDGAGPNYDAIYAYGFRNAFRLSFTPDGTLLVADVGQNTWEEVDLVTRGANYGWPNAEGPCNGIGTTSCATPSSYTNPIYAYLHAPSGGDSITSVMAYTGLGSAGGSNHTVLIADFNQGWVRQLTFNSDYSSLISATQFTAAPSGQTDKMAQGPDGNIYQLQLGAGTLTRITASTV
jgi:glucose/arabinose dehydrogenase